MALERDSWAVSGAESSARIARLQLQSATRGGNGIVEAGDLAVTELDVPGPAVKIAGGAAVAFGREATYQGSYYAFNVGDDQVSINPTGSGAGRSDMVILRVEDPNIDGTPWAHDPANDPIYYFRVIEGVDPTATDVPEGTTGVPLARIDIPPSTATITQDMITDLRVMMDPRTEYVVRVQRGVAPTDYAGDIQIPDWEDWPNLVWTVDVPEWATQVQVDATWGNAAFFDSDYAGSGAHDARGRLRVLLGSINTDWCAYNFNVDPNNGQRVSMVLADQIAVPASMRGTTQNLRMQVSGEVGVGGRLRADGFANFVCRLNFLEVPVPDIDE